MPFICQAFFIAYAKVLMSLFLPAVAGILVDTTVLAGTMMVGVATLIGVLIGAILMYYVNDAVTPEIKKAVLQEPR